MNPSGGRERILDSAVTEFVDRGFHGARLQSVARRAGLEKSSLFHHFPGGKEDLHRAVLERARTVLAGASERAVLAGSRQDGPEEEIKGMLRAFAAEFVAEPWVAPLLLRRSLDFGDEGRFEDADDLRAIRSRLETLVGDLRGEGPEPARRLSGRILRQLWSLVVLGGVDAGGDFSESVEQLWCGVGSVFPERETTALRAMPRRSWSL